MKKIVLLMLGLLFCINVYAQEPSEVSVKKLLEITQAKQMLAQMRTDSIQTAELNIKKTLIEYYQKKGGVPRNFESNFKAYMDIYRPKLQRIYDESLSWHSLEASYIEIFQSSYTQEEVNQLIDFYQTPTGQLFVLKAPMVNKKMIEVLSIQLTPVLLKTQQAARDSMNEFLKKER